MNELDDYREVFETITELPHKQGMPAETAVAEYAPGNTRSTCVTRRMCNWHAVTPCC